MLYVFVDTNIWFRIITQGQPGCELEHFQELKERATKGTLSVVLPEVVRLELDKLWTHFPTELEGYIEQLLTRLKKPLEQSVWNEIDDIQNDLLPFISRCHEAKLKDAEKRHKDVLAFLNSPYVLNMDLQPDMWLRAKKRLFAGKVPPKKRSETEKRTREKDADLCIVETLSAFFAGRTGEKDTQLLFCSENKGDFALEDKEKKLLVLHPCHAEGLPAPSGVVPYFTDLKGMVTSIKKPAGTKAPTPKELVQALAKEKTRVLLDTNVLREYWVGTELERVLGEARSDPVLWRRVLAIILGGPPSNPPLPGHGEK